MDEIGEKLETFLAGIDQCQVHLSTYCGIGTCWPGYTVCYIYGTYNNDWDQFINKTLPVRHILLSGKYQIAGEGQHSLILHVYAYIWSAFFFFFFHLAKFILSYLNYRSLKLQYTQVLIDFLNETDREMFLIPHSLKKNETFLVDMKSYPH